jgi:phage baseplate assembly protein W
MARNTRTYSDLDFNFMAHPVSGDVTVKYDIDAVKQSIKSLVMTKNFERPFRSSIGSQVNALLFEPSSPITSAMIERTIRDVIDSYEPRVDLLDVKVTYSPNNNSVYVTIYFKLKNTESPLSFNLILERTR